jgi:hypothetical protein
MRDATTGVGLVGILITGNADGVRKSRKSVCHRGMLSRPHGNFLVKFGASLDDRSLEIGASHKNDHSFQKETWQFELQSPVTSSFRLEFFSTVRNHYYTLGLIFWHISGLLLSNFFAFTGHLVHINQIPTTTACGDERDEDCRSICVHPMVQTYDPWGLGSGQSEHTTHITRSRSHRPRFGRHTAFVNEPCAICKPDCICSVHTYWSDIN